MNPTQLPTVEAYPFDVTQFIDLPANAAPLKLGAIAIPVYGSVTRGESEAIEKFWQGHSVEDTPMQDIWQAMTTILLVSRYRAEWSGEMTAKLPIHVLEKCFNFVVNEQVRWQELRPMEAIAAELPQKKTRRTTAKSTGGFAKPSQEKKSSVPDGLPVAQ